MSKEIFREIRRSMRGNTYIVTGLVLNTSKVGCPQCDTIYLKLVRDNKEDLLLCITPEEALIISRMLNAAVDASIFTHGTAHYEGD